MQTIFRGDVLLVFLLLLMVSSWAQLQLSIPCEFIMLNCAFLCAEVLGKSFFLNSFTSSIDVFLFKMKEHFYTATNSQNCKDPLQTHTLVTELHQTRLLKI